MPPNMTVLPPNVFMNIEYNDKQNRWYCYEIDRYENKCIYRRGDADEQASPNHTTKCYFRWSSTNANNNAQVPFHYLFAIKDMNMNKYLAHGETYDTQTPTYFLPVGHNIQLTLQVIDRVDTHSPLGMFNFKVHQ